MVHQARRAAIQNESIVGTEGDDDILVTAPTAVDGLGGFDTVHFRDRCDPGHEARQCLYLYRRCGVQRAAGELRAVADGDTWLVSGDRDGDGGADFSILVASPAPLAAADFIL